MGIQEGHTALQHVLTHDGVGVEQQHILALRLSDGLVVGSREAPVVGILHEMHAGKARLQILHTAVGAGIVHHPHLGLKPCRGPHDTAQALFQVVLDVVANYYDAQFHHISGVLARGHCSSIATPVTAAQ